MGGRIVLLTPGPVEVDQRVLKAMARPPVSHRSPEFSELLERIIERLRDVYGARGPVVVMPGGGTAAVDAMVHTFIGRGSRVLVASAGEFGDRMAETAKRTGALVDVLSFNWGDPVDASRLLEVVESTRYDALLLVHNETSTGMLQHNLEAIARRLCGMIDLVLVDAVSSLAATELKLEEWCIDAIASASHKAIGSVPGVAFVAVGEDSIAKARGSPALNLDLRTYIRFYAEKRQTPYTPPVNALYALDEALGIIFEHGIEAWIREYRSRASAVYGEALKRGIEPLVREEAFRSTTVAVFKVPPGVDAGSVAGKLAEKGFLVGKGMGKLKKSTVRIGLMGAVTIRDLVEAVRSMDELIQYLSEKPPAPQQ